MAGINATDIKNELLAFNRKNNRTVESFVYAKDSQLAKHAKTLIKVNGKYPIPQAIMGHVVQGFRAQWDAMGELRLKNNELVAYRQKVNFPFKPNDIYSSWLGDMYDEGKKPDEHPISKYIMNDLLGPAVKRDNGILEITGKYGEGNQTFGASMNGIEQVLTAGIADVKNPMIRNVLPGGLTEANIVDQVKKYEKYLEDKYPLIKNLFKKLYMSSTMATNYKEKYEQLYGVNTDYTAAGGMKTKILGMEIIPLDYADSQTMFATPNGNMVRMIDVIDAERPAVTDVQVENYDVKVFMEFTIGYGFVFNQMVCVATYSGASGLVADHDVFFG